MYLLDTNIVSELRRRQPNAGVINFMKQAKSSELPLYLSVITLGEIEKGILKLAHYKDVQQAQRLSQWRESLLTSFCEYLLPVDADTSVIWGRILAATDDTNAIDKLLAATALQYDLTLATRNISHVHNTGVKFLDPFHNS